MNPALQAALQSDTQLKLLALEDWLSSDERGFVEVDCRGGTFTPSFLSAAPAILTQASHPSSLFLQSWPLRAGKSLVEPVCPEGTCRHGITLLSEVAWVNGLWCAAPACSESLEDAPWHCLAGRLPCKQLEQSFAVPR